MASQKKNNRVPLFIFYVSFWYLKFACGYTIGLEAVKPNRTNVSEIRINFKL